MCQLVKIKSQKPKRIGLGIDGGLLKMGGNIKIAKELLVKN